MGYKKIQSVPSIMISYQSASLFQCLSAEEKDVVWNALMNYVDKAKQKDQQVCVPVLPDGLSKIAYKVFDCMLENVDNGFNAYWKRCDQNAQRIKKRWDKEQEEKEKDTVVYRGIPWYTEKKRKEMNKNNLHNLPYQSYAQQLNDAQREAFVNIIETFKQEGFYLTEEQTEDIARKIKFDELDEESAKFYIDVCVKRGKIDMGYFFACLRNMKDKGWDSSII